MSHNWQMLNLTTVSQAQDGQKLTSTKDPDGMDIIQQIHVICSPVKSWVGNVWPSKCWGTKTPIIPSQHSQW